MVGRIMNSIGTCCKLVFVEVFEYYMIVILLAHYLYCVECTTTREHAVGYMTNGLLFRWSRARILCVLCSTK